MSESTAVHLIFFIVVTAAAAGAATMLATQMMEFGQGVTERTSRLDAMLATDIVVINDPSKVAVNPTQIYVKNIGTRTIAPTSLTVIIDGKYVNHTAVLQNNAVRWAPGDVVRLTVSSAEMTVPPGDHTLRVSTEYGTTDIFRFRTS